uniref:Putative FBD-associated F-box protein n=1 Tax=Noccaea caerulescens TaxID=107243 RepID=A0A1J3D6I4_NOCCA
MVRISDLSNELLIKILTFLPTKVAVSTSILSKQWQFLWMWLPKLEFDDYLIINGPDSTLRFRDFINKNLPLHKSPVIESLLLRSCHRRLPQPENIKLWVGIAVSRFVRELSIGYFCLHDDGPDAPLPSSLYTCSSLTTLKLEGTQIVLDVPRVFLSPFLEDLATSTCDILKRRLSWAASTALPCS